MGPILFRSVSVCACSCACSPVPRAESCVGGEGAGDGSPVTGFLESARQQEQTTHNVGYIPLRSSARSLG
jgi:hypothetical protein